MKKSYLKNTICAAVLVGAMVPISAAFAEEGSGGAWDLSGTLAVTNDYRFRGVSQTTGEGAVQLGLTLAHEGGFYGGVWFSNVDFDAFADIETDLYVGFSHDISDATNLDVALLYYIYNDEPPGGDYNYFEAAATLTHTYEGGVEVHGQLALMPEMFGGSGFAWWTGGGVSVPVLDWVSVSGNVGYHWIDDNATFGVPDYLTWNLGVTATWEIIDFDARYIDTDIGGSCTDVCDGKFVLTATLNL